ncbi:MAG: histidine kinase [Gemmatimonadales bacterium]|nr:histidine kinase [Gemmatimonadales bacterium]MBT7303243.1 histidine kinase [Victivallales bacterium]
MEIQIDTSGTVSGFRDILAETVASGARFAIVLACEKNAFDKEAIDPLLKGCEIPIFGGIFPSVFHGTSHMDIGTIVVAGTAPMETRILRGISEQDRDLETEVERFVEDGQDHRTVFVLVDGFSPGIGALVDALFTFLGMEHNMIGGGVGSLQAMASSPCLITNEGLLQDSAVVAFTKLKSHVGVCHGFETVYGPFRVTKAAGNTVLGLDYEPAADVYGRIVSEHHGAPIPADGFFDVAKAYPFGIARLGGERVVRDPILVTEEGGVVCVGEIPEGSVVHILHGSPESLLDAAAEAKRDSLKGVRDRPGVNVLIDCVSRVLFLGDRFAEELAKAQDERPLVGAATVGEIAGTRSGHLEFYNKTCVISRVETA